MTMPERSEFEPTDAIIEDLALDFGALLQAGYPYAQAIKPDPSIDSYTRYGYPFGMRIVETASHHPELGTYNDMYLHSLRSGVLLTDRFILSAGAVFQEYNPGMYKRISDEDVYYLHKTFRYHTNASGEEVGGILARQEVSYYKALENILLGKGLEQLDSFFNYALHMQRESLAEAGSPRVVDLSQGIGSSWMRFGLSIHDEISVLLQDGNTTVEDRIGDLVTLVDAQFSNSGTPVKYTLTPYKYRSVNSTETETLEPHSVVLNTQPVGTVYFPMELTERQRVMALSDVNRILAQSRLVVA